MSFALQEGTVFAGRYRVVRCIALGGMGAVYEVVHLETERRRALKVMLPQILESAELRERFKREARVAAQIESDFIVDVFDAGVDDETGMPFLVMELLRGEEIGHRLTRVGRLAPNEVISYLYQTALALDKTHKASIVHRDLKPENLFLTQREHGEPLIKVLDFGIAKFVAETAKNASVTRSIGTPTYMAPEQFRSGKITPAVDIYALGMIAYTLLVGIPYWEPEIGSSDNVFAFGLIVMKGPKEPPTERAASHGAALPSAFDAWFTRATAVDPEQRFSTATSAIEGLAEVFGIGAMRSSTLPSTGVRLRVSLPPDAVAQSSLGEAAIEARRGKNPPLLAVGVILGVLAVAGVALAVLKKPNAPSPSPPSAEIIARPASATAAAVTPPELPSSAGEGVEIAPASSVSLGPSASPSVSAAVKPSIAPTAGPRKPRPAPGGSAPAAGRSPGDDSIYSRD